MSDFWTAVRTTVGNIQERLGSMFQFRGMQFPGLHFWGQQYDNPWPPPADRPRLKRYRQNKRIYEAEHEQAFVRDGKYEYDEDRPYLFINVCGEITDVLVDRLFGEELGIQAPKDDDATQGFIDHLSAICNLETFWGDWATQASYCGDGVLKIRYDGQQGEVLLEQINPVLYFVIDDTPLLAWIEWDEDNAYLFQEWHFPGSIENRLYELSGNVLTGNYGWSGEEDRRELSVLPQYAGLPDEQPTGVDEPLLIHIVMGTGQLQWGRSDYSDITALQGELNNRATQRAEILDKHAYPRMAGPKLYIEEHGDFVTLDDYIEVESESQIPQYITWDAQMGAVENELRDLKRDILMTAGLSPASFQMDEQGGLESGRALKLRQHRTASAVRRRQQIYGPAIRRAISLVTKLYLSSETDVQWQPENGDITELQPEDVRLIWQDGLPNDRTEEIEQQATMVSSQLTSHKQAIMELHGLGPEEADTFIAEIGQMRKQTQRRVQFAPPPEPVAPEEEVE